MYWNGTAWVTLAGNFTGTQVLTESSSGVPSWTTPGTVTSVTAGTGLSGGTITTTGTITLNLPVLTASLGVDVTLSSTYVDGPSIAQGTTGTWWANGTVTLQDTAVSTYSCKLWDGTTIMSSGQANVAASVITTMSLSGTITTPAGNIKISCKDAATGKILFNASGNSKDSTLSAARIQ
jgi:hypothetical protein